MIETWSVFTEVAQRGSHLRSPEPATQAAGARTPVSRNHGAASALEQEGVSMSKARRTLLQRVVGFSEADALGAGGFAQASHGITDNLVAIRAEVLRSLEEEAETFGLRVHIDPLVAALATDERSIAEAFAEFGGWAWSQSIDGDALLEIVDALRTAASRVLIVAGAPDTAIAVLARRCAYALHSARDGFESALHEAAGEAHVLLTQASKQLDAVDGLARETLSILRLLRTNEDGPWAPDEGSKAITRQAESLLEDLAKVLA